MSQARSSGHGGQFFSALLTLGGLILQFLGVSGVADSVLRWRSFFEVGVMRHYESALVSLTGEPASTAISAGVGYLLSCIGFFIAALQTMLEHRRYLSQFKVPPDYFGVEERMEVHTAVNKVENWSHARANSAVLRLFGASLIWPLFLLWALYVWLFRPRRKPAVDLTEDERRTFELSGFDYGKAAHREGLLFAKWAGLMLLGFLAILFVFADFGSM
jgi:hypothetical protein